MQVASPFIRSNRAAVTDFDLARGDTLCLHHDDVTATLPSDLPAKFLSAFTGALQMPYDQTPGNVDCGGSDAALASPLACVTQPQNLSRD